MTQPNVIVFDAEGELITQGTIATVDNGAGGDTTDYAQYTTKHTRFTLDFDHTRISNF